MVRRKKLLGGTIPGIRVVSSDTIPRPWCRRSSDDCRCLLYDTSAELPAVWRLFTPIPYLGGRRAGYVCPRLDHWVRREMRHQCQGWTPVAAKLSIPGEFRASGV